MEEKKIVLKPKDKFLINQKELEEVLGIGSGTAYNLVKTKGFPVVWIGNRARIVVSKLDKWLEDNIENDISRK